MAACVAGCDGDVFVLQPRKSSGLSVTRLSYIHGTQTAEILYTTSIKGKKGSDGAMVLAAECVTSSRTGLKHATLLFCHLYGREGKDPLFVFGHIEAFRPSGLRTGEPDGSFVFVTIWERRSALLNSLFSPAGGGDDSAPQLLLGDGPSFVVLSQATGAGVLALVGHSTFDELPDLALSPFNLPTGDQPSTLLDLKPHPGICGRFIVTYRGYQFDRTTVPAPDMATTLFELNRASAISHLPEAWFCRAGNEPPRVALRRYAVGPDSPLIRAISLGHGETIPQPNLSLPAPALSLRVRAYLAPVTDSSVFVGTEDPFLMELRTDTIVRMVDVRGLPSRLWIASGGNFAGDLIVVLYTDGVVGVFGRDLCCLAETVGVVRIVIDDFGSLDEQHILVLHEDGSFSVFVREEDSATFAVVSAVSVRLDAKKCAVSEESGDTMVVRSLQTRLAAGIAELERGRERLSRKTLYLTHFRNLSHVRLEAAPGQSSASPGRAGAPQLEPLIVPGGEPCSGLEFSTSDGHGGFDMASLDVVGISRPDRTGGFSAVLSMQNLSKWPLTISCASCVGCTSALPWYSSMDAPDDVPPHFSRRFVVHVQPQDPPEWSDQQMLFFAHFVLAAGHVSENCRRGSCLIRLSGAQVLALMSSEHIAPPQQEECLILRSDAHALTPLINVLRNHILGAAVSSGTFPNAHILRTSGTYDCAFRPEVALVAAIPAQKSDDYGTPGGLVDVDFPGYSIVLLRTRSLVGLTAVRKAIEQILPTSVTAVTSRLPLSAAIEDIFEMCSDALASLETFLSEQRVSSYRRALSLLVRMEEVSALLSPDS